MSRKNNKQKQLKRHQKNLNRERPQIQKMVNQLEDYQQRMAREREEEAQTGGGEMGETQQEMEAEGIRKGIRKERKFKVFQKRVVLEAKRRRKNLRKAPVLVGNHMQEEL